MFLRFLRLAAVFGAALFPALLPARAGADAVQRFTIVELNDVYEVFPVAVADGPRTERRGGLAYVATVVNGLRAEGPVLFLHAGDMFSPSLLSTRLKHRGAQMVQALNALSLDAATFGNHEFDYGCQTVLDRVRESQFPWIVGNVVWPATVVFPADKVSPARIFSRAGLRIGVFGVTVPLAPVGGCADGEAIAFSDPITAARNAVAGLKRAGADVIVGLTHQRMEEDKALAAAVPGIDVIIGGHEHEVLAAKVGKTLIVKSGTNAINLGVVRVAMTRGRRGVTLGTEWQMLPVDAAKVPPDPSVDARLEPYRKELAAYAEVIGRVAVPLDAREDTLRGAESNVGDYVADVVRARMQTDVALLNGGGFRDDRIIPPGPFTLGDLYTLLPFSNELVAVEVSGAQLLAALENGVSLAEQNAGRFPQVSGMRFRYTRGRPPGRRIVEVRVAGKPLDLKRRYTLATTDFLLTRGAIDGYAGILPQGILRHGGDLNDALVTHIRNSGPINAVVDGRIRRVP
jgi:5'-nucleotidase / UDP-sugar diphosphatase